MKCLKNILTLVAPCTVIVGLGCKRNFALSQVAVVDQYPVSLAMEQFCSRSPGQVSMISEARLRPDMSLVTVLGNPCHRNIPVTTTSSLGLADPAAPPPAGSIKSGPWFVVTGPINDNTAGNPRRLDQTTYSGRNAILRTLGATNANVLDVSGKSPEEVRAAVAGIRQFVDPSMGGSGTLRVITTGPHGSPQWTSDDQNAVQHATIGAGGRGGAQATFRDLLLPVADAAGIKNGTNVICTATQCFSGLAPKDAANVNSGDPELDQAVKDRMTVVSTAGTGQVVQDSLGPEGYDIVLGRQLEMMNPNSPERRAADTNNDGEVSVKEFQDRIASGVPVAYYAEGFVPEASSGIADDQDHAVGFTTKTGIPPADPADEAAPPPNSGPDYGDGSYNFYVTKYDPQVYDPLDVGGADTPLIPADLTQTGDFPEIEGGGRSYDELLDEANRRNATDGTPGQVLDQTAPWNQYEPLPPSPTGVDYYTPGDPSGLGDMQSSGDVA